ncbi:MAG TPA: bifunctional DNA-formamidopyrimidine glycosylase/DNA-(apurinic or apyrimidinic site) lyase [Phycisphaerales bacterium]|nr:bifunctional DNA-formamidopyrimidine glycosylase/DNA-(apurinic or apyrimidinic site) lyase [Phycisphaerales bacterium]
MPELPEVESIRLSLEPRLVGRRIVSATLFRRDVLIAPGDPPGGFSRQRTRRARSGAARAAASFEPPDLLEGSRVAEIRRRGKQLAIIGAPGRVLVVQLGMTGHLGFVSPGKRGQAHVHAEWLLDDGSRLIFRDPRRFGSLRVLRSVDDLEKHWLSIRRDALSITPTALSVELINTRRTVKAALLDQRVIAGVGNIYADEALFAAGLHPAYPTKHLTATQTRRLAFAIRKTLRAAIRKGGSTLRDYADAEGRPGSYKASHRVYGRAGLPCVICHHKLRSCVLAQRTTVWCPSCQPPGPPPSAPNPC